jgi:hypothetical protein
MARRTSEIGEQHLYRLSGSHWKCVPQDGANGSTDSGAWQKTRETEGTIGKDDRDEENQDPHHRTSNQAGHASKDSAREWDTSLIPVHAPNDSAVQRRRAAPAAASAG